MRRSRWAGGRPSQIRGRPHPTTSSKADGSTLTDAGPASHQLAVHVQLRSPGRRRASQSGSGPRRRPPARRSSRVAAHWRAAAARTGARPGPRRRRSAPSSSEPPIDAPAPNAPVQPTTACQASPSNSGSPSQAIAQRTGRAAIPARIAPTRYASEPSLPFRPAAWCAAFGARPALATLTKGRSPSRARSTARRRHPPSARRQASFEVARQAGGPGEVVGRPGGDHGNRDTRPCPPPTRPGRSSRRRRRSPAARRRCAQPPAHARGEAAQPRAFATQGRLDAVRLAVSRAGVGDEGDRGGFRGQGRSLVSRGRGEKAPQVAACCVRIRLRQNPLMGAAAGMPTMVPGYVHRPGMHCGSTALRNLLAFHGVEISEEMAFGLGAGACFYYVTIDGTSPSRWFNGRTARLEENFAELTGAALRLRTFESGDGVAWEAARAEVDAGNPGPAAHRPLPPRPLRQARLTSRATRSSSPATTRRSPTSPTPASTSCRRLAWRTSTGRATATIPPIPSRGTCSPLLASSTRSGCARRCRRRSSGRRGRCSSRRSPTSPASTRSAGSPPRPAPGRRSPRTGGGARASASR